MALNARYRFVLLCTVGWSWIADAGLPLHRYRLDDSSAAHAAVEQGAVGKVLITIDAD